MNLKQGSLGALLMVCVLPAMAGKLPRPASPTLLHGVAALHVPMAKASITVCDRTGASKTVQTDRHGAYMLEVSDMQAPILVAARQGNYQFAALRSSLEAKRVNTANVNPLTDKIASDVATSDMGLKGSVQLIAACKPDTATLATIDSKTGELRGLLLAALKHAGVKDAARFDPVSVPMHAHGGAVFKVLQQLRHNREGYSNSTSNELGSTNLYDRDMMEVRSSNPLDPTLRPWRSYARRIFVAGDSTASNYNAEVLPRMGWGQVFDRQLKAHKHVKVVNVAQSGRSSRSFITEGWFAMIAEEIRPGDYLLVQFGHNDEKCDVTGSVDWTWRCTYPNDSTGALPITNPKFPAGKDEYSFQKSLEKYVQLAVSKGAIPVLITPVTRINRDSTVAAYVEGKFPITKSTHITSKGDIPGDYSATVLKTAADNKIAAIDLDAKSIAFYNSIGVGSGGPDATGGWRDYYLSVSDFAAYPYYGAVTTTGHYLNADRTHSKESGAVKLADMIVEGIKADPTRLQGLIDLLK